MELTTIVKHQIIFFIRAIKVMQAKQFNIHIHMYITHLILGLRV